MPCVAPLEGYRARRKNPETGKRPVVFNPRDGFIDQPIDLPCGKCSGCQWDKARDWTTRMVTEASTHEQNCFITLTYSDPPEALDKSHCQHFLKRLRHQYKFRYFLCGEYGSRTKRPHYHAIIFGQDFLAGARPVSDTLYTNPIIETIWEHGIIAIGECTPESCAYVAGYVQKKRDEPDTFNLMSRRPGIGHTWLDKNLRDIENTECIAINGKKKPVPKRYVEWKQDELLQFVKKRKAIKANEPIDDKIRRRKTRKSRELNYAKRLEPMREMI